MSTYDLYVESGPRHRTTMVHVPALLGCVAVGPTTADALQTTPEVIAAFRRFQHRHGEIIDPGVAFEVRVAEHKIEGLMHALPTDMTPLSDDGVDDALTRVGWLNDELGSWAAALPPATLDERPETGWAARRILLHVLESQGNYLESAFGSGPEIGPTHRRARRGETQISVALQESVALCRNHVALATTEQRRGTRQLEWGSYTLHRALRRMNEHAWEHLVELSRRPGGPEL